MLLRKTPQLSIDIKKETIEIVDLSEMKNCGVFEKNKIAKVQIEKDKINWLGSILSFITLFLDPSGVGGNSIKKNPSLKIELDNKIITLDISGANMIAVKKVTAELN
jgi:hypothetical protein